MMLWKQQGAMRTKQSRGRTTVVQIHTLTENAHLNNVLHVRQHRLKIPLVAHVVVFRLYGVMTRGARKT